MSNFKNKPSIWLYDVVDSLLGINVELKARADLNIVANYYTYEANSAGIMSEFDAVVWRTQDPLEADQARTNQLLSFLMRESGIFVFFLDKYQQKGSSSESTISVVRDLLLKNCPDSVYAARISRKFLITNEGKVSPFREYFEYEPQKSFLTFLKSESISPLVINVDGDPIAFSLIKYKNYTYFLPPPINGEHLILFIKNLLEAINRYRETPEGVPTWTKNFAIPGFNEKKEKLNGIREKISKLEEKADKYQGKLNNLTWLRDTLLARDGRNLENAVKFVLESIKFNPIPGPAGQEDIVFKFGQMLFLAEIKGSTSSSSEGHIKQLNSKLTMYQEREQVDMKGVLIINAWRQYQPSERENKDRTVFPDAIMKLVNIWEFVLVTSLQILEIYCLYLQEKLDRKKLANELYNTIGPIKNYELRSS